MLPAFSIDPADGGVRIEGIAPSLKAGASFRRARGVLAAYAKSQRDFGNGYAWLKLEGISFGGLKAAVGLCFHDGRLSEANWGVWMPEAALVDGWPTKQTIDDEIAFVRGVLHEMVGREFGDGDERFDWGTMWCGFDAKGFQASSGLRYTT